MSYGKQANYNNNNNGFNKKGLENYETVKARKMRIRMKHENAIMIPVQLSNMDYAGNYVVHGSLLYKDKSAIRMNDEIAKVVADLAKSTTPQNAGMVLTAMALITGADSVGHSLSIAGGSGADKNAWVENSEESSVGRALDNAGYHSGSCSQEEVEKVQHMEQAKPEHTAAINDFFNALNNCYNMNMQWQFIQQSCINAIGRGFDDPNHLSTQDLRTCINVMNGLLQRGQSA